MDAAREKLTASDYFAHYPETNTPSELIDGELMMSPAPSSTHQQTIMRLMLVLIDHTQANGTLEIAPSDVHLTNDTVVQPDLFYVAADNEHCQLGEDDRWHGPPDLCVEVISPSSQKVDRITKFDLYAAVGVREYWLVDPAMQTVEIYTQHENTYIRHGAFTDESPVTSPLLPTLNAPAKELFQK